MGKEEGWSRLKRVRDGGREGEEGVEEERWGEGRMEQEEGWTKGGGKVGRRKVGEEKGWGRGKVGRGVGEEGKGGEGWVGRGRRMRGGGGGRG